MAAYAVSTGRALPYDGLCKPKRVGATMIILNDFKCLTIYNNLCVLVVQMKDLTLQVLL